MLEARMKLSKNMMILIPVCFLLLTAGIIMLYGHAAVLICSGLNDVDVSYKKMITASPTEFVFRDLKVVGRHRGIGLSSSGASVKLIFDKPSPLNATADFSLNDVQFIRKGGEQVVSYNDIDGLLALPFSSLWNYKTISGKINSIKDGIKIRDFLASGDTVKFSIDGTMTGGNVIDADITIYFSGDLAGKIPPELANMALRGGEGGWKSLTLKVKGDLAKPSIQITGKLFRLNIGVK